MNKQTVVIHSGGMDSSLCLALACKEFGEKNVLSLSFIYDQRHLSEITQARKICLDWGVDHTELSIDCLKQLTKSALIGRDFPIERDENGPPSTLVVGRNGLMAHLGGIHAHSLGAHSLYMGVMELEGSNSGYRDCSRAYMNLQEQILRLDLNDPFFEIRTPLMRMTKEETMELACSLGLLSYLWEETVTCYEGIRRRGCGLCPACQLRNRGFEAFLQKNPDFSCFKPG